MTVIRMNYRSALAILGALALSLSTAFSLPAAGEKKTADAYVAVGHGGHRMVSADGNNWQHHQEWGKPGHDNNDINVVASFKDMFIAGGGFSFARLTATRDGQTWSEGRLPGGGPVFGLDVVGDELYVTTIGGHIYVTADGENYQLQSRTKLPNTKGGLRRAAAGNGLIVAVGDFGNMLVAADKGRTTTTLTIEGQEKKNANRVAFGNGVFVVSGQKGVLGWSKDGTNWKNLEPKEGAADFTSVAFDGRRFFAASRNAIHVSDDGIDWKTHQVAKAPREIFGTDGVLFGRSWPPSKVVRSADGLEWEPVPNEKNWYIIDVARGRLTAGAPPPKLPGARQEK